MGVRLVHRRLVCRRLVYSTARLITQQLWQLQGAHRYSYVPTVCVVSRAGGAAVLVAGAARAGIVPHNVKGQYNFTGGYVS